MSQNKLESCEEKKRCRISYSREFKLTAISYALKIKVRNIYIDKLKLISKYAAVKKLKIIILILKK